jgi:hypothetical protein
MFLRHTELMCIQTYIAYEFYHMSQKTLMPSGILIKDVCRKYVFSHSDVVSWLVRYDKLLNHEEYPSTSLSPPFFFNNKHTIPV